MDVHFGFVGAWVWEGDEAKLVKAKLRPLQAGVNTSLIFKGDPAKYWTCCCCLLTSLTRLYIIILITMKVREAGKASSFIISLEQVIFHPAGEPAEDLICIWNVEELLFMK